LHFRATLQPVLTRAFESIRRQRGGDVDVDKLVEAAWGFISEQPRTFAEISAMLKELVPEGDVGAMRYAVRTHLPLIQVPTESTWSYPGNPQFAPAEEWLDRSIPSEDHLHELIVRYLAAFGPATVRDIQTWSGLEKLKPAVDARKSELVVYRDERRRELFDVPDMPVPDGDAPLPARFLPEYDNLLLSHQDRTRVVGNAYRKQVFLPGLRVAATFLVDGFVAGTWSVEQTKRVATLTLTPFERLTRQDREALIEEGERLARFVEADAQTFAVRIAA
jgi:hypothetical protein